MFLELAQLQGAKEVWMADLSEDRLKVAQERGAKTIVVGKEKVKERIKEAEVVVVAAPSSDAQKEALEIAGIYGRINFFGGLPPQVKEVALPSNLIHYKELVVTGTTKSNNFHFRSALDLLLQEQLDLSYLVSHVLPLERIEEGLSLMERQQSLKVVIVPE
jgi:L-iditol 2-dehydrogenase